MSYESPTPDNTLVLRNLQGLRREMMEMVEGQRHTIELIDCLTMQVDGTSMQMGGLNSRMTDGFASMRSSIGLTMDRMLSAQSDIIRIVGRLNDAEGST